jgi:hypothetical protein
MDVETVEAVRGPRLARRNRFQQNNFGAWRMDWVSDEVEFLSVKALISGQSWI